MFHKDFFAFQQFICHFIGGELLKKRLMRVWIAFWVQTAGGNQYEEAFKSAYIHPKSENHAKQRGMVLIFRLLCIDLGGVAGSLMCQSSFPDRLKLTHIPSLWKRRWMNEERCRIEWWGNLWGMCDNALASTQQCVCACTKKTKKKTSAFTRKEPAVWWRYTDAKFVMWLKASALWRGKSP